MGYDADGNEWVHARGVWYPCLENIYQDIDDQEIEENRVTLDERIDMWSESERAKWACIPPPSPLVRQTAVPIDQDDPLDYPLYDYEDPRDLD